MKLNVTTVVEVQDIEVSYAILDALMKAYKDIADVSYLQGHDKDGYTFKFEGVTEVDFVELEKNIRSIVTKTVRKEKKEEAEKEARAKKNLEGFQVPVLPEVKNRFAKMMDEPILKYFSLCLRELGKGEYVQAESYWADAQDLITVRMLLNTKPRVEVYKYARNLDTIVRESIPDKVYRFMVDGEE